jgi:hypothetical protein
MPRKPIPRNKPFDIFCNGEVELYSDDAPCNDKNYYSKGILKAQGTAMCSHIIECIEQNKPLTFMKNIKSFNAKCDHILSSYITDPDHPLVFRSVLDETIKQLGVYFKAIEAQPLSERSELAIKFHSIIKEWCKK